MKAICKRGLHIMQDPRNNVRNSIENLMKANAERERLVQHYAKIHHDLDIARQQNFMAVVDLLNIEQLSVLENEEFFEYALSSLMSWKSYVSNQQSLTAKLQEAPDGVDAPDDIHFSDDDFDETVFPEFFEDAESIFNNASIDLAASVDVEKALNDVLSRIGFRLTVLNSVKIHEDGSQNVGIIMMACIDDIALFLREAENYPNVFTALAEMAHYGDKKIQREGMSGGFSFALMITEHANLADPKIEKLPVVRAGETESPFDEMTGGFDVVWTLHKSAVDMAENNVHDIFRNMMDSVRALEKMTV